MTPGIIIRVAGGLPSVPTAAPGLLGVCWRPESDDRSIFLLESGELAALAWADFFASTQLAGWDLAAAEALCYLDLEALSPDDRLAHYAVVFSAIWPPLRA